MKRTLDRSTVEIAIDSELSRIRFHCENCRELIRERAIGMTLATSAEVKEETFEEDLTFMAAFEVRYSVLAQGILNTTPRHSQRRALDRAFDQALEETNDRFYGRIH
jgi:hypothetical protein